MIDIAIGLAIFEKVLGGRKPAKGAAVASVGSEIKRAVQAQNELGEAGEIKDLEPKYTCRMTSLLIMLIFK